MGRSITQDLNRIAGQHQVILDLTSRCEILERALRAAKITHYTCEDCWYSCPLSAEGCCDEREKECNCGAEKHNAAIDSALDGLEKP